MTQYGKPAEVYGFQTLFREIGYYISRLEQYENSLRFFDEALKKTANDKRALTGRSRARAKVSQYEGALEDINKALGLEADDLVVLADKALNTYLCCEFEEGKEVLRKEGRTIWDRGNGQQRLTTEYQDRRLSLLARGRKLRFRYSQQSQHMALVNCHYCHISSGLVQNSRLVPKRQKPENFSIGVMHCSDAIENCVGERTGRPLRDHFKIIRKLAWKKNYAAHKPFEPKPSNKPKKKKERVLGKVVRDGNAPVVSKMLKIRKKSKVITDISLEVQIKDSLHSKEPDDEFVPTFPKPFPFKPLQNYTTNIENYMAEKYLDSMYLDKIFLKKLQSEPGALCPNKEGSMKIRQLAQHTFRSVSYKQELLRTRRPFYFIKYQEATVSGALRSRQIMELEHQQRNTKIDADAITEKMNEAYNRKELKVFLDMVKKLKRFCDGKPKKLLPDKQVYMNEIWAKLSKAWYEYYRINDNQGAFEQERRIYSLLGLPISREPSTDSIVCQFKNVFIDFKKEIFELEKAIEEADMPDEICWYYHELSRFNFEVKKYDLSRFYARKCIHEAGRIDNKYWAFNCLMIMTKSNLSEHNKNDAKNDIVRAIACAEKLNDPKKIEFLKKCLEVVESFEFEDVLGTKQLQTRENKIIQMMASSKMKDEVAHLFRQMAAMPASRRMVVIPGVRAEEKGGSKTSKGRALSIMHGQSEDRESKSLAPTRKRSETQSLKVTDLIEFHV